jgi:hypothetical protein
MSDEPDKWKRGKGWFAPLAVLAATPASDSGERPGLPDACRLCGQRHPRLSRNETCPTATTATRDAQPAEERLDAERFAEALIRAVEQADHDYMLHDNDISDADQWTEEMMAVYSATVGGVLLLIRRLASDQEGQ